MSGDRFIDTCVDGGEFVGEPLASEERSEPPLIDTMSSSVKRLGQSSASSSKTKDLAYSNVRR